jgi:hypothetical protein
VFVRVEDPRLRLPFVWVTLPMCGRRKVDGMAKNPKVRVEMNYQGIRAVQEEVGRKIADVDAELRGIPLVGKPVDDIKAKAKAAFAAIGVELPEVDLTAYSQSVSDGEDFEFKLS